MRLRGIVLLLVASIALYLAFWPVPVDPVAWNAPVDAGFTGPFAKNERLRALELLPIGGDHGPETIAVDEQGRVCTGTKEGRILRDGRAWLSTGDRPLGLKFDRDGTLYVADALLGLLRVTPEGQVTTLVGEIGYPNSVDVSPAGDVYFTDSSAKFSPRTWNGSYEASLLDILEHGGHGRLLVYHPSTHETRTLIANLNFPNGVAVSPDGAFVLVAETGSYRVLRHWLAGPNKGRTEPLIENLPGFPDNLTAGRDGRYWIGLVSPATASSTASPDGRACAKPFSASRNSSAPKPSPTATSSPSTATAASSRVSRTPRAATAWLPAPRRRRSFCTSAVWRCHRWRGCERR